MNWTRGADNAPWWDAETGHRVLACRVASGWRYLALGPDRTVGWDYRAWRDGQIPHWSGEEPRGHYDDEHPVPMPRALLGSTDNPEAARALCAADAQQETSA